MLSALLDIQRFISPLDSQPFFSVVHTPELLFYQPKLEYRQKIVECAEREPSVQLCVRLLLYTILFISN